jgi:uncharacterized delta-60 repeat protein
MQFGGRSRAVAERRRGRQRQLRLALAVGGAVVVWFASSVAAFARAGGLDTTFAGDGTQSTSINADLAIASDVAVEPGGTIAVTGEAGDGFGVVLYTANGDPDARFSGDGLLTGGFMVARAVGVQADGRIVVVGGASGDSAFSVARYRPDGTPDRSFSRDGRVVTNILGAAVAYGVALQPGGRILVGGQAEGLFALARYKRNGSRDRSFGRRGIRTTRIAAGASEAHMALAPGGKIVLAGTANDRAGQDLVAVARYSRNGSPDRSFSGDGKLTSALGGETRAYGVAVQPDGKILVAGTSGGSAVLLRYTADGGGLDPTFGAGGKVLLLPFPEAEGTDVAVQSDGKILAAIDGELNRFNADGTPDATFGANGKASADVGVSAIALQPDGRIVICGRGKGSGFASSAFGVARFLSG